MPKKKELGVEDEITDTPVVAEKAGKSFIVLDSNGKQIREVATEEEAKELAKIYSGKVK